MAGGIRISRYRLTKRFKRDYKRLPGDVQDEVEECLKDLVKDPIPKRRRFEKLNGYRNPNIYTVHVTNNHSYKMSMEIEDEVAILRRVAKHKVIDRDPK